MTEATDTAVLSESDHKRIEKENAEATKAGKFKKGQCKVRVQLLLNPDDPADDDYSVTVGGQKLTAANSVAVFDVSDGDTFGKATEKGKGKKSK